MSALETPAEDRAARDGGLFAPRPRRLGPVLSALVRIFFAKLSPLVRHVEQKSYADQLSGILPDATTQTSEVQSSSIGFFTAALSPMDHRLRKLVSHERQFLLFHHVLKRLPETHHNTIG
jgi:hypothetical protein